MRTVRVVLRGRVQGVGFRWFTRAAADAAGVQGWVRNRRAGAVEAELHGPDDAIERMLTTLADGPAGARVDDATVTEAASDAAHVGFEIRATV